MRVCVIGGAGYIGSHAVYELIEANHEVVVIDNLSTGTLNFVHKDSQFVYGDITNFESLNSAFLQAMENGKFDAVMLFAAKIVVSESMEHPSSYYYSNVEGVRITLEVLRQHGIKNIIFSSTAAIYGETPDGLCNEESAKLPVSPYGETKLVSERMIEWFCYAHNMNYCIFRYFNVAGAHKSLEIGLDHDHLTHVIPVAVQTAIGLREKMIVFGDDYDTKDGTCVRDYVHVSDIAYAHLLGMEYIVKHNKSEIINLGSNSGYSVKEIIDEVSRYKSVKHEFGPRRAGDAVKIIASNEKAKRVLGWSPKYNLKDIIKSDIDFRLKLKSQKSS